MLQVAPTELGEHHTTFSINRPPPALRIPNSAAKSMRIQIQSSYSSARTNVGTVIAV